MSTILQPAEATLRIHLRPGLSTEDIEAIQKLSTPESFDATIVDLVRKGLEATRENKTAAAAP